MDLALLLDVGEQLSALPLLLALHQLCLAQLLLADHHQLLVLRHLPPGGGRAFFKKEIK